MLSCEPMSLKARWRAAAPGVSRLSVLSCEPMSLKGQGPPPQARLLGFQCSPVSRCR